MCGGGGGCASGKAWGLVGVFGEMLGCSWETLGPQAESLCDSGEVLVL